MIGIIGAMDIEVDKIKNSMDIELVENLVGIDFFIGKLFGVSCVLSRCGVGKVNAAICANTMALKYSPKLIINSGVAGGIGKGVHIGDVVVASACVQHDSDTTVFGDPKGFVSTVNLVEFPCDKINGQIFVEEAKKIYPGNVFSGVIATGDQFIADGEKCLELNRNFGAIACEMESGAIAHAAYISGVPFVALRSISDNANESGTVDFTSFAQSSADKVIELLSNTIGKLKVD